MGVKNRRITAFNRRAWTPGTDEQCDACESNEQNSKVRDDRDRRTFEYWNGVAAACAGKDLKHDQHHETDPDELDHQFGAKTRSPV